MNTVREISASEAATRLATDPDNTLLLDVREAEELVAASVAGALHIPMASVPGRLGDISPDKHVICMCHLGGRSAQVAAFLTAQGYQEVSNLTGGIEAWSQSAGPDSDAG